MTWVANFDDTLCMNMPDLEETRQRALAIALRQLSYRPRSTAEVQRRLQRQFPSEVTQWVVQQLHESGLLDDSAFSRFWREARESTRPRSAALMMRELMQKGVQRDVAQSTLQDADDTQAAYAAAQRFARRLANADYDEFHRKLDAHLRRRGFGGDTIRATVRALWKERQGKEGD